MSSARLSSMRSPSTRTREPPAAARAVNFPSTFESSFHELMPALSEHADPVLADRAG